MNVKMGCDRKM